MWGIICLYIQRLHWYSQQMCVYNVFTGDSKWKVPEIRLRESRHKHEALQPGQHFYHVYG